MLNDIKSENNNSNNTKIVDQKGEGRVSATDKAHSQAWQAPAPTPVD